MENLPLRARVAVRTSKMKISRRHLPDYVKNFHQKACRTCSTIIFPRSTNQFIDLWRCRCRRHFLNSLLFSSSTNACHFIQVLLQKRRSHLSQLACAELILKHCVFLVAVLNFQVRGASVQISVLPFLCVATVII